MSDIPRVAPVEVAAAEALAVPQLDATEKVSARVARAIARHVAEERLAPGTMLEPEQEMARRFQVGRPSVREALRLLESQGLVKIRRGVKGGPVVAAPSAEDLGHTLTMFLQMRSTPLRSVIDAAAALEGLMAGLASQRVADGEASIAPLRDALAEESRVVEKQEQLFAGMNFHRELYRLGGAEVLELLVRAVGGIVADRTRVHRQDHWDPAERRRLLADHVELFEAVERGESVRAFVLGREHRMSQADRDLKLNPEIRNAIVDWR
jgi:DNA-binding FadR family transcriptional regulator